MKIAGVLLALIAAGCGRSELPPPAEASRPTRPVPAEIPSTHLDNASAATAESMMDVLSKSLKGYEGDPDGPLTRDNVVWFEVAGAGKAFFQLPRGTASTWWPCPQKLPAPGSSIFSGETVPLSPAFMVHSPILSDMRVAGTDVDRICRHLRMAFRCREEGTVPNVFQFTVYIFLVSPEEWSRMGSRLPDPRNLEDPKNGFLHKFDFLVGRT